MHQDKNFLPKELIQQRLIGVEKSESIIP